MALLLGTSLEHVTNSLRVQFDNIEGSLSVAQAYEVLAQFGEVARLELPPGLLNTAVASYYDIRAATSARAALGERCLQEPQYGERTLELPGDVCLMPWMIQELSAVRQEGHSGSYSLDFFDTRSRERAAKDFELFKPSAPSAPPGLSSSAKPFLSEQAGADSLPVVLPVRSEDSGAGRGPRYRTDLLLSKVNWDELASGLETRTTLRLRCLPRKLCNQEALKGALSNAGLSEAVDCMRAFPGEGKRPGSALINVLNTSSVAAVAKLFHGRQWGTGLPVAVSFAAVQGREAVEKAYPEMPLRAVNALGGTRAAAPPGQAPRRIEAFELHYSGDLGERGSSEASTEAGDDSNSPRMERVGLSLSSSA